MASSVSSAALMSGCTSFSTPLMLLCVQTFGTNSGRSFSAVFGSSPSPSSPPPPSSEASCSPSSSSAALASSISSNVPVQPYCPGKSTLRRPFEHTLAIVPTDE
eukprot:4944400-Prymnesium_polylepis.1